MGLCLSESQRILNMRTFPIQVTTKYKHVTGWTEKHCADDERCNRVAFCGCGFMTCFYSYPAHQPQGLYSLNTAHNIFLVV